MSTHHTNLKGDSQPQGGIFSIYKKPGETLAELVLRFRKEKSFGEDLPITYAGRLDPMAEGLVLLLAGQSCKQKDDYLGLEKTYVFEVLFGISTDTFDMLGIIQDSLEFHPSQKQIQESIENIKKIKEFPYPPYSSKPVDGKALFIHAKEGSLPKDLPTMKGEIHSIVLQNTRMMSAEEVVEKKIEIIKKVKGDFRQEEILKSWQKFLKENKDKKFMIATFEANVSSGIYIRTLATMFGGLAYSIKRVKIGEFEI